MVVFAKCTYKCKGSDSVKEVQGSGETNEDAKKAAKQKAAFACFGKGIDDDSFECTYS